MIRRILMTVALVIFGMPVLFSAACGAIEDVERSELYSVRIADDLSGFASDLRTAVMLAADAAGRGEEAECFGAFGDCVVCWSLDGDELSGVASGVIEELPCATSEPLDVDADYSVSYSRVDVAYSGDAPGDYALSVSGARDAALDIGYGSDTERLTASWEVVSATATFVAGSLTAASIELRYPDFGGAPWQVSATADADAVVGTATRDDGALCAITGTLDEPRVACDQIGGGL